jgi:hypothetical protein
MKYNTTEYWRKIWRESQIDNSPNGDTAKTLDLLVRYTGAFQRFLDVGVLGKSRYGRFFSGRLRTQHANEVERAIAPYYNKYSSYLLAPTVYKVEYILSLVKQQMNNTIISPNGTLTKILTVIKEKTGVDYDNLDIRIILNNDNRTNRLANSIQPDSTTSMADSNTSNATLVIH